MGTLGQALGWKGDREVHIERGTGSVWRTTAVSLGITSLCIQALSPLGCVGNTGTSVCLCGNAYMFLH